MAKASTSYKQGVSGNKAGRPKGAKNAVTIKKEEMLNLIKKNGGNLVNMALKLALEGDKDMIKFTLNKILPELKSVDTHISGTINIDTSLLERAELLSGNDD